MIPRSAAISFTATGDTTVVAIPASGSIKVYGISFSVNAATTVTFKDTAANSFSGAFRLTGDGSSITLPVIPEWVWFHCQPGRGFVISTSSNVAVGGTIWYLLG